MDPIFDKTTPIHYALGKQRYRATGVFFQYAGDYYLVTNKHVVDHEHGVSPEFLRIVVQPKTHDGAPIPREVQLFNEEGDQRWITPNVDGLVDIAIVPLRFDLVETGNGAFSSQNVLPETNNLELAGGAAIVLGYPERFGGGESNTPVARSGLIATKYGHHFQEEPRFLLDANLQEGMSGSPVLLKPAGLFHEDQRGKFTTNGSGSASRFLGIHSGPVERGNDIGLHSCWYARLIRRTIAQHTED